ncbi:MAG: hypothetical protein KDA24_24165 [Deltaproteobacteria bacterium]|nr:hypothetical protein [Deltaproteobacteria bacterium]
MRSPAPLAAALVVALAGCPSTSTAPQPPPEDWGQRPSPVATCIGNSDDILTADEIAPVDLPLELRAAFLANGSATVSLPAGWLSEDDDGFVVDLRPETLPVAADDRQIIEGPAPLSDAWFGADVPGEWHALIDSATGTRGVFTRTDDAVLLSGLASEAQDGTAVVYEPSVPLFALPMVDGDSWEVVADAVGLVDGVEYPSDQGASGVVNLIHRWSFTVDGAGTARLPGADLRVLRLRLVLRTEAWNSIAGLFAADTARATFFVAECAGTVARLRSGPDELDADFTVATEVLRFGLSPELLP